MEQQNTRVERISSQIKSNPIVASVIILGTIVVALSTFTDAAGKLFSVISNQSPAAARIELSKMSLQYTPGDFVARAKMGDLTAVKLFLIAGMDPNATTGESPNSIGDDKGQTALMSADSEGHTQIVAALVNAGADVKKSNSIFTASSLAASGGHIDSLRVLIDKGTDVEAINDAFVDTVGTRQQDVKG